MLSCSEAENANLLSTTIQKLSLLYETARYPGKAFRSTERSQYYGSAH